MGSGKNKPIVTRRKQVLKFGESTNNSQFPSVDPYRQTSTQPSTSYEGSQVAEDSKSSTEADTKLKDLLNEIDSLGSRNSREEEPMNTEQTEESNKADPEAMDGTEPAEEESAEEGITFWKQLTDPNTNHAYYWSPKTNQVTWTLPNNGVIADENPNEDPSIVEADNPYAEYYAYYKQYYGSTQDSGKEEGEQDESAKESETAPTASTGSVEQSDTGKPNKAKGKESSKKSKKPTTETEAFVGPVLPSHVTVAQPPEELSGEAESVGRPGTKRKAPSEEQGEASAEGGLDPASKKPRLKGKSVTASPVGAKKSLSPQSGLAEQALRFQVSNMADELTRKLGFLHVTNEGLSDIQLLSIQLQTRLSDWKEGGINSKFMLSKLKSSAVALQEYEKSAAPDGWKVVWDSSSCRYQYHNLSTGETTWQYPAAQLTESGELSSHEESSDNETAPESPLAENPISQPNAQTSRVTPVLAPVVLSKVSSPQPPPAPPTNSVGRPQVTTSKVAPRNKPTQPEKPKSAQQGDQFTVKESVSQSTDYEGPTREYMTAGPPPYRHYKSRFTEVQPPPPPPKCELTVDQVREKLYPSLRPRRYSRQSEEASTSVLPPEATSSPATEEAQEPVPMVSREGVEFISVFPPPSEEVRSKTESSQSESTKTTTEVDTANGEKKSEPVVATSKVSRATFGVLEATKAQQLSIPTPPGSVISESTKPASDANTLSNTVPSPSPAQQADPSEESEARLRERLLERQKNRNRTAPEGGEEATSSLSQQTVPTSLDRVEQATGEHESSQPSETPSSDNQLLEVSNQHGGADDSRVEPETGEVETIPDSNVSMTDSITATQRVGFMPEKVLSASQQKAVSQLYQDWTPSPTEGRSPLQGGGPQGSKNEAAEKEEEGEVSMESESSSSSDSGSEGEGKSTATGKDSEKREEQRKRSSTRRSSKYDHSDPDHDRHSDSERSSRRHRSSKRSRRDYSSDESEERHSKRDRHRRSRRHDDRDRSYSDDERSKRRERSSRSSHRSSRKNRSRSRSSHRRHHRSRSHSRDSQSSYRSDRGKKKSPKHKKTKKEKKKKHHKSEKDKERDKNEETPKPPPNVIVGKVGRISSKRTLGQEKKPNDEPETPKTPGGSAQSAQQVPQAMSASYYQQPSTGQVPYYNMDPYYQGYYDPSVYQQWGQGQWYGTGQTTGQAATGTIQYPTGQYGSTTSQYSITTTSAAQAPQYSTASSEATQAPQYTTASSETAQAPQYTTASSDVSQTPVSQAPVYVAPSETVVGTAASSETVQDTAASSETVQDTAASSETVQDTAASSETVQDTAASSETVQDTAVPFETAVGVTTSSKAAEGITASEPVQATPVASTHEQLDSTQTDAPQETVEEFSMDTGSDVEPASSKTQEIPAEIQESTTVVESVYKEIAEEVVTEVVIESTGSKVDSEAADDSDSVRVVIEEGPAPDVVEEKPESMVEQQFGQGTVEVEMEEEITECDMEIDDNSPSPDTVPSPESTGGQAVTENEEKAPAQPSPQDEEPLSVPTTKPVTEDSEVSVETKQQEEPPPLPTLAEDAVPPTGQQPSTPTPPEPPSDESKPPSLPSESSDKPSDKGADTAKPSHEEPKSEPIKSIELPVPPAASTPPTPPAAGTVTTTPSSSAYDYSAYMLASQQQQAYNYAYATNNYMQAAYSAYMQQASAAAAAYQAYGAQYYPGYGNYATAGSYASPYSTANPYYGASPTTQAASGSYGKVALQLAQAQQNTTATSSADSAEAKKSEFTLAGSKSKQMKSMMTKWSSFKEGEDSPPS